MSNSEILFSTKENAEWWRSAVIYQIYPRSFADGNGDGMGDLKGVTARLDSLVELGIDAIWFSPFMLSPQKDAGYDITDYKQIDPLFGNLEDFDAMLKAADAKGIRIIVDMVPNHSSDQNELFQKALKAAPGSPERDMYIFRDGKGLFKRKNPNNWPSVFGGASWTRIREANGKKGQYYLHIFDSTQPDFNWRNPKVIAYFEDILRFWLDRGVAGFRIDVAHGLIKRQGLPDTEDFSTEMGGSKPDDELTIEQLERKNPYWGQPEVHEINRKFRKVVDSYDDRIMAGEAWIMPLTRMAEWVRPDEYHQAFNFDYMFAAWSKEGQKNSIDRSLKAFGEVGAPSTWVLSNHDVIRHATRFAYNDGELPPQGDGIGAHFTQPDQALGLRRARAATSFMLGLPGGAYLYQGEELGLPEHTTLDGKYRQDPTWFRTKGKRVGRDGCRVPLPWEAGAGAANGFNTTGESWLPQPDSYRSLARNLQSGVAGSTLELYKRLLKVRKELGLGAGNFRWAPEFENENSLAYVNGKVAVIANFGTDPIVLPKGEVLVTSQVDLTAEGYLETDQTAWVKLS
jgi:alpha-glucosidase